MNYIVVEDDSNTRSFIKEVISQNFSELQCWEAENLQQAELLILEKLPELLILDVNLPDGKSIDFLFRLIHRRAQIGFKVIFITAFSDYAMDALRLSAVDFLLKPISPIDLIGAVEKSIQSLNKDRKFEELESFFYQYGKSLNLNEEKKIVLRTTDNVHVLSLKNIYYARSENNYTNFEQVDAPALLVSQPLKYYEEKLSPLGFLRVHQSYLVNMDHVTLFEKRKEILILSNAIQIPVSQSKKSSISKYLHNKYL